MATSTIEQLRQYNEDIEHLEKAGSKLLAEKVARSGAKALVIDHLVKKVAEVTVAKSQKVLDLFADKDGMRKDDIAMLAGSKRVRAGGDASKGMTEGTSAHGRDVGVWTNFYDKLKEVKDYHRKNPSLTQLPVVSAHHDAEFWFTEMMKHEATQVESIFSGEEDLGRRVDLSTLFLQFTNLTKNRQYRDQKHKQTEIARLRRKLMKGQKHEGCVSKHIDFGGDGDDEAADEERLVEDDSTREALNLNDPDIQKLLEFEEIDYITYLKTFDRFHEIPRHCKYREKQYAEYIEGLLGYLKDLFTRQNPLIDEQKVLSQFEFESRWENGIIPGWLRYTHKLPFYSLPVDRLFASEGTFSSHQKGKKHQKTLQQLQSKTIDEQKCLVDASEAHDKNIAKEECLIQFYRDLLAPTIERTIEHFQKKQSRGIKEILGENIENGTSDDEANGGDGGLLDQNESSAEENSDDEEDRPVYNPLNLPLGWDGKPIPYWLYKLHGLGREYKCEICGNYSYWGRRAFERHFQEWRHAFGMRCLRIPNTSHFKEITKIEDAITLYEKLKQDAEMRAFINGQDVECEDSEGNVMSAKAYDDLRRQGLL